MNPSGGLVPGFRPAVSAWAREAAAVVERFRAARRRWASQAPALPGGQPISGSA
nr:hypothetical protein [Pseudarthrobacter sp. AB1]